jgi:hypothetical protein
MRRNMKRKFCAAQTYLRRAGTCSWPRGFTRAGERQTRGSPFGIAWLMLFRNFDAALHAAASAFD